MTINRGCSLFPRRTWLPSSAGPADANRRLCLGAPKRYYLAVPLLLLLVAPLLRAAERTVKPNILFILADDLGWSDLGCYGNKDIKTPNLNRLAQTGALFTQFYAAAPVCSPSRAAFFTGQYPARLRIHSHFAGIKENEARAMPQFLDPATPNIAGLLRSAGYATCHVGKWHLRNNVSQLADEEPIDERGQGPTPASYGFDFVGSGEPWGAAGPKDQPYYRARSTERLVDETIRFIRGHREQPFYAQLWTLVPHARLNPTPAQLQPYAHLHPGGPDFPHASAREIYYASVTDLDTQLGRLLAVLEELGIAKDTLVIFSSDNGPEDIHVLNAGHSGVGSANPFRGRKRSLYEGGIRVPLLVRWPTRIEAGRIDEQSVVAAIDLLPTLCSVAGVTAPQLPAIDGEDMSDLLLKGPRPRQRPLFWETRYATSGEAIHQSPHLAIRDGGWKLLTNRDGSRTELYHLEEDPLEVDNLAETRKDLTKDMRKLLLDWSRTLPPGPIAPATGRLRHPWPDKTAARTTATPPR